MKRRRMSRDKRRFQQGHQDGRTPIFERLEQRVLLNAVPYSQDFSLGKPGVAQGWEYYSDAEGRIDVVAGRLRMDDTTDNLTFSLNEAILHVDLTGQTGVKLRLDHTSLWDENTPLPASFDGHYKGDGIALSVDGGSHWVKVTDLGASFTNGVFDLDPVLAQAIAAAGGSANLADVQIKFQQYDNWAAPNDGREFDNIQVLSTLPIPEIEITGNGQVIADNDLVPSVADGTEYGAVVTGGSVTRTFTISNPGTGTLNLTGIPRIQLIGSTDFSVISQPAASVAAGGTTTFQVRFAPTGSGLKIAMVRIASNDGDENPYDFTIQGTASALTAQAVPYSQDFSLGKPGAAQGWEYYSDAEGRIDVVSGRLRLDDTTDNLTYSLNEAILHVNLTGQTGVKLRLDHVSLLDENTPLPASFDGHYKGDGIALSVDGGSHWIKVTDLTTSFTNQTFDLDPILAQAIAAAGGSANLADVQIKFQQYDNWAAPNDGREFDNIQVVSSIPIPEIEITGNGQVIADNDLVPSVADGTDYGTVATGGSVTRTFTISNPGTATLNLTGVPRVQLIGSTDFTVILQPAASVAAGGATTFQVRFAPTGSGLKIAMVRIASNDGDENPYDFNIQGTASALAAQPVPYSQDFSLGKPGAAQGWEYYSDAEGRIAVVGGRLRLDDTTDNLTYSLNEAILHVNLTGQTGVTLRLDHVSLSDEDTPLPASFDGHYKGDGIALSVDGGSHWIKVTDLTASFTNQTFDLDPVLAQAIAAAGASANLADVQIKFQQYDNYAAPTDGRELDNIQVVSSIPVPEIEITGNGQVIADNDLVPSVADGTDYGTVSTGGLVTRTFTISNPGTAMLNLTGVPRVQLIGSTDFTVILQPAASVAAGGTTMFQVRFAPTGSGLKIALVRIASNDGDENPYDFNIQGTASALPEIEITGNGQVIADNDLVPSVADGTEYGTVSTSSSVTRTFTISNLGTSTLNLTGVPRVQLIGSTDFTVIAQPAASVAAGGTTTFQVRFAPTGSGLKIAMVRIASNDGDENPYDFNIQGTASVLTAQPVPYSQDFSLGKPGAAQGWEYYSDAEGRIDVVAGRLRLDDTTDNLTYSLNEAILHVNLTGQTGVKLRLDHVSLFDENTPLPASFDGHYKGDGIALSVDGGSHWVKVTDLTTSFTNQTFDLDPVLAQAIAAAGASANLADVQIKFQQYDNWAAPNDGREFDNIQVVSSIPIPEIEITGNGQVIADNDLVPSVADGTEYGAVLTGGSVTRTFTINNPGTGTLNLTGGPRVQLIPSTDFTVTVLPAASVAAGGSTTFQVRFAPTGSGLKIALVRIANNDGDENPYDFTIQGTASALTAQAVPYSQDFSLGKPGVAQGWEYYSDAEGRIDVVGGRLRLDDTTDNLTFSLNEAILHVNLTGQTGVTLRLDHTSLWDENTPLPASFDGHYKGDGIALSVDGGSHWIKVTDLTTSFTNGVFNLDPILAQAIAAAGASANLADVQIKFQQYDNWAAPNDGREFDNIWIG